MLALFGSYLIKLSSSSNKKRLLVVPRLLTVFTLCFLLKPSSFMSFSKESPVTITFSYHLC